MTDTDSASRQNFQQKIYQDLDEKLRSSEWNSGVPEAHGLLCGLACRGINDQEIRNKLYLFQLSDHTDRQMLEGLFGLISRDLSSEEFHFDLLLPDDTFPLTQRIEEITNWCQGFLQGFCHDGEAIIHSTTDTVSEMINDILEISHIDADIQADSEIEDEKSLFEVGEYLRVGVQLIYDELNPASKHSGMQNQTH